MATTNTTIHHNHPDVHVRTNTDQKHTFTTIRWSELVGEFVGAVSFIYFSGYVVLQADAGRASTIDVAVANAFILGLTFFILGRYYLPQVNPAITIANVVTRRQYWLSGLLFIIVQLVGSIVGAALLKALTPEAILEVAEGASRIGGLRIPANATQGITFFNELVFTIILVIVYRIITTDRRINSGALFFALGGTYLVSIIAAAPVNITALNPARAFGPAVIGNIWEGHWIWWVAPILGAIIGAIVFEYVLKRTPTANTTTTVNGTVVDVEDRQNLLDRDLPTRGEDYNTF